MLCVRTPPGSLRSCDQRCHHLPRLWNRSAHEPACEVGAFPRSCLGFLALHSYQWWWRANRTHLTISVSLPVRGTFSRYVPEPRFGRRRMTGNSGQRSRLRISRACSTRLALPPGAPGPPSPRGARSGRTWPNTVRIRPPRRSLRSPYFASLMRELHNRRTARCLCPNLSPPQCVWPALEPY